MPHIKVLGTGCANCKTTLKLIEDVAAEKGVAVQLEKIEDIQAIMGYGIMSTPGVVFDGKVVHAGGVPSRDAIADWLAGNVPIAVAKPATAEAQTMSNQPFEISIAGIWCGTGFVRVKKAIQAVPGVSAVKLDLPRSIAIVEGTADHTAVAAAVGLVVKDAEALMARGLANTENGKCGNR